jgi:hypothetical protein
MKKSIFAALLLGCVNAVIADSGTCYSFVVRVTHDQQDFAQEAWKKSVSWVNALAKTCSETSNDPSAQAFSDTQGQAITVIKDLFGLCENEPSIHISTAVSREPLSAEENDMVISFEYTLDSETCSMENTNQIDALMVDVAALKANNLDVLENLQTVFQLMSGQAALGVYGV